MRNEMTLGIRWRGRPIENLTREELEKAFVKLSLIHRDQIEKSIERWEQMRKCNDQNA